MSQAKQAANVAKKGTHEKKKHKKRTSTTFKRPGTLKLARKPKYERKGYTKESTWDKYSIIKYPVSTESAMKVIEDNNTLVFVVDRRANKHAIRKACE